MINNSFVNETIQKQLEQENLEPNNNLCSNVNLLKLYFGDDFKYKDKLVIHQPTIQDFIDFGEKVYYEAISPFVSNTTGYRLQLWDLGIDWNTIEDIELFAILVKPIDTDVSKRLFNGLDFSKFTLFKKELQSSQKQEYVLRSDEYNLEFTQDEILEISSYIQHMFNVFPPEPEFCSNKTLKQDLINKDRQTLIKNINNKQSNTGLIDMISFCLNHPGFKYKKNELREVCIFEFMDSVRRLQVYESTSALMSGLYSGMCDLSKIDKNEFNFMRHIDG